MSEKNLDEQTGIVIGFEMLSFFLNFLTMNSLTENIVITSLEHDKGLKNVILCSIREGLQSRRSMLLIAFRAFGKKVDSGSLKAIESRIRQ